MSKLILTADQIYALAYILKAKYLDYYYISQAKRVNNNGLWLSECTKQLVSSGVLTEDFSGDTSIDSDLEELLKPIYFSTKESSLDINILGDNEDNIGFRFHYLGDKTVMTKTVDEGIEISDVSSVDIINIVNGLIAPDYSAITEKTDIELDISKISRVFVVKNIELNVSSQNVVFLESDGMIYEQNTDSDIFTVSYSDFTNRIIQVLTEV